VYAIYGVCNYFGRFPGPALTAGVEEFIMDLCPGVPFLRGEHKFMAEGRPMEITNLITPVASEYPSATTGGASRVDGGVANSIIP
jgi:hypothetical protein